MLTLGILALTLAAEIILGALAFARPRIGTPLRPSQAARDAEIRARCSPAQARYPMH
jgi:hypothetical protein